MKPALLLLLTLTTPALAQIPYADLLGEWRISYTDDPRNALPETDDTAWPVFRLPFRSDRLENPIWIRRSVTAPLSPNMALGIGRLAAYQAFVNGVQVADVHQPAIYLTRYIAHHIPSAALSHNRPITVALRVIQVSDVTSVGEVAAIGDESLVRLTLEVGNLGSQRGRTIFLLIAAVDLVLASVILFLWLGAREQGALLWLALYLLGVARGNADAFVQTVPQWEMLPLTLPIVPAFTFEVTRSALALRLTALRIVVWSLGLCAFVWANVWAGGSSSSFPWRLDTVPFWAGLLFSLRTAILSKEKRAIALALTLLNVLHLNNAIAPRSIRYVDTSMWIIQPVGIFGIVASTLLLVLMLRNFAADRRERMRLSAELEAASTVQKLAMAAPDSTVPDFKVDAVYTPALEVGGDFYQLLPNPDGSLIVAVGDVSGKGLKAAMTVSLIVGVLEQRRSNQPAEILHDLNRALARRLDGGFVTAICGLFEPGGRVTLANAGHPSPYLQGAELTVEPGLPLGLTPDSSYSDATLTMLPEVPLTFVTDGVIEAANGNGELYGFDRTREISTKPAAAIAQAAQAWGQNDDITVVTIRRRS